MVPTFFASEALEATGLPGKAGNSDTHPIVGDGLGDPKSESESPSSMRASMLDGQYKRDGGGVWKRTNRSTAPAHNLKFPR